MCNSHASSNTQAQCCAHSASPAEGDWRLLAEYRHADGRLLFRDPESDRPLIELDAEETQRLLRMPVDDLLGQAQSLRDPAGNLVSLPVPGQDRAAATSRSASQQERSAPIPPSPTQMAPDEFDIEPRGGRTKLWQLPHNLHCPVIGTCFEVEELRRLAGKNGCEPAQPLDDYRVHVSFVAAADEKNRLSLATHKALEKKFGAQVRRCKKARDADQLAALWEEHVACGEVPGAFWAVITHPRCDTALRKRLYEEVHMLSHQIGAGQRADLRRLSETQDELRQLKREFDALHHRTHVQLKDRDELIHQLHDDIDNKASELIAARELSRSLRAQVEEQQQQLQQSSIAQLRRDLERHQQALQQTRAELETALASRDAGLIEQQQVQQRLADRDAECVALERLLSQSLTPESLLSRSTSGCAECESEQCETCPNLNGQRILCVGGRNRLLNHYRSMVTRCNGHFDHHDGGLEDNRARLEAMLSSADVVVCAVDCVSHDAYYRLKKACKRQNKPHVFLDSSGISTFARAIESVAAQ